MSLNQKAYFTVPTKVKKGNKDVLNKETTKARKKPQVRKPNVTKK